jgi:hypothetical protein
VSARGGGIENQFEIFFLLEQTVDAFGGCCQTLLPSPRQTLGITNNRA